MVRDPIYGYIRFTIDSDKAHEGTERALIDSVWLQRLRDIRQLQSTWLVYPGAEHTRFQHSLGVMHLAGEFAAHLHDSYIDYFGPRSRRGQYSIPERNYVIELFRVAGLLHDVGHGPLGHALDDVYEKLGFVGIDHEVIGRSIITKHLGDLIKAVKRSPYGRFDTTIEPGLVCDLIKPPKGYRFPDFWLNSFAQILRGTFDADKLDFLARDAHFCGTREYGTIDDDRLIRSSFVREEGFTVLASALPALKAFLWSRLFMYENVYYHRTVRSFDLSFSDLLPEMMETFGLRNPVKHLKTFATFTDGAIKGAVNQWLRKPPNDPARRLADKWQRLQMREIEWHLAEEMPFYVKPTEWALKSRQLQATYTAEIKRKFGSGAERFARADVPFLGVHSINPAQPSDEGPGVIHVYDSRKQALDSWSAYKAFVDIPVKFMGIRLYARRDKLAEVRKAAPEILGADELARTSF